MSTYKRILIVSNECFSSSSSNGRTLMNFFKDYDKESIAQFFLHGTPDQNICSNYFQVTDTDAKNAFLGRKIDKKKKIVSKHSNNKVIRNCRNLLIRDIVWRSYRWWSKELDTFISTFNPECILLQAGDSPFMFHITRRISKRYSIPIIIYNSESYVLKEKLYSRVKKNSFFHKLLQYELKGQYKAIMKKASYCIYSTEALEQDYQIKYPHPGKSKSLYVSSSLKPAVVCDKKENDQFHILYCGNLGVGRAEIIVKMANVFNEINKNIKFIICGSFPTDDDLKKASSIPCVDYRGRVSYQEALKLMSCCDLLVHCENTNRVNNLYYAFSTKIADCLALGKPFLVYASEKYPFVQYLHNNKAAYIAQTTEELNEIINQMLIDNDFKNKYINNAILLAKKNHNIEKNSELMKNIIEFVVKQ